MKTPTREDFQAVAEWLGVSLLWIRGQPVPYVQMPLGRAKWQPHLPGIDSYMLMAAMKISPLWLAEQAVVALTATLPTKNISSDHVNHDNTIDGKAAALASAVWQCAVKVARAAKR